MDSNSLVAEASELITLMDGTRLKPRAAMWVHNLEQDSWQLWIVPGDDKIDKLAFFRQIADIFSKNREKFQSLDISDVRLKTSSHPAIAGLSRLIRLEGLGSAHLNNNVINGLYLPDGIVLRMAA